MLREVKSGSQAVKRKPLFFMFFCLHNAGELL